MRVYILGQLVAIQDLQPVVMFLLLVSGFGQPPSARAVVLGDLELESGKLLVLDIDLEKTTSSELTDASKAAIRLSFERDIVRCDGVVDDANQGNIKWSSTMLCDAKIREMTMQ